LEETVHLQKRIGSGLLAVFAVFGALLLLSPAQAKIAAPAMISPDGPQPPPPTGHVNLSLSQFK
jgi:hypothetical protein